MAFGSWDLALVHDVCLGGRKGGGGGPVDGGRNVDFPVARCCIFGLVASQARPSPDSELIFHNNKYSEMFKN